MHKNNITIAIKNNKDFKDTGVLNSCMKALYEVLELCFPIQWTFGYITKAVRLANNIEKSHANDASIIALCDCFELQDFSAYEYFDYNNTVNFKQFRRHIRNWIHQHEDRKYYALQYSNKAFAWNRKKRVGQKKRSLVELKQYFRDKNININFQAKSGGVKYRKSNTEIKFKPGDIFIYNNKQIDTCKGWASTQGKVIGERLSEVKQGLCKVLLKNSGLSTINSNI